MLKVCFCGFKENEREKYMKLKIKLNEKVKTWGWKWDDQNEVMEKWKCQKMMMGRRWEGGGSDVSMEDVSVSFSGDDEPPLK